MQFRGFKLFAGPLGQHYISDRPLGPAKNLLLHMIRCGL